jgi:hypothetical protein
MQSDANRVSKESLRELAETSHERRAEPDPEVTRTFIGRRRFLRNSLMATGGIAAAGAFGTALLSTLEVPAFAASSPDVMMLQTAASIENLAVMTYKTALTLPYVGGSAANAVVKAFVTTTMAQHTQHAAAFNSAITTLGGQAQNKPDPKYVPAVNALVASPTIKVASTGLPAVVKLAITLENVAAETYVNDVTMLQDMNARATMASIMGIEAQHVATLLAAQALVAGGASQLIALPTTTSAILANDVALPAAAGSVGFPNVFYPTTSASPADEGAVTS